MSLTNFDEYLCHQIVSTFDQVDTSDRQWTERASFIAHDTSGKIMIDANFGKYTNRNVMDAFGGVVIDGVRQHIVRASRELRSDIDSLRVGPLSYEVLEPFKRIRLRLDENDYGIGYDVEFEATMVPVEELPLMYQRERGVLVNHMCRYYQLGRASGWVTVEGRRYDLHRDKFYAQRDRSWGIRKSTAEFLPPKKKGGDIVQGFQPEEKRGNFYIHVVIAQFKDWGLNYTVAETLDGQLVGLVGSWVVYPFGDARQPVKIVDIKHEWDFNPATYKVKSCRAIITTADGVKREMSFRPLTVHYLRPGGYFGWQDWVQGQWMGSNWVDGLTLDLTDEELLKKLHGVDDTACEYRCGDDVGYGIIEPFVGWAPAELPR